MTTAVSLSAIHSHPSTFPPSGCKHGWPSHRADSYFEIALSTHRRGLRKRERERGWHSVSEGRNGKRDIFRKAERGCWLERRGCIHYSPIWVSLPNPAEASASKSPPFDSARASTLWFRVAAPAAA